MIVGSGLKLVIVGLAIGVPCALAAGRWLSSVLFQVSPTDPLTLVTAAATLLVVSLAACSIPARRATRIDPLAALRL
jgi:ABC-type antimicrobial peptide transport system permease subunit